MILFKRGPTASCLTHKGEMGNVIFDTGLERFRLMDGVTDGGFLIGSAMSISDVENIISTNNLTKFEWYVDYLKQLKALNTIVTNV